LEGKNILVLTGSPRKNGNSNRMAEYFVKGAFSGGHNVVKFETASKKIFGCRSCDKCWEKGKPCFLQDDFDDIVPYIEDADVILLATPLYWFSFSMQIKAVIDRMYAFIGGKCKERLEDKESLLFVCGSDKGMKIFDGIIATYKEIVNYLNWIDRGVLAVPNVKKVGDIEGTGALLKAEEYGISLN